MRKKVVILCGQSIRHEATSAIMIEAGLDVVGVFRASGSGGVASPLRAAMRWARQGYFFRTVGQIVGRLLYNLIRGRQDRVVLSNLYDVEHIRKTLEDWDGEVYVDKDYSAPAAVEKIRSWNPDLILVHSGVWVGKKVRSIPSSGLVVGGHPGITPLYRGAHSAFWAIYNNQPELVGWSAFHLDSGVDTGDLIAQGKLKIEEEDSYVTLGWKGMIATYECLAKTIIEWEKTGDIPQTPHETIPKNSEYPVPGLLQHFRYWRNLRKMRKKVDRQGVDRPDSGPQ